MHHTAIMDHENSIKIRMFDPSTMNHSRISLIIGCKSKGKSTLQLDLARHMAQKVDFGVAFSPTSATVEQWNRCMHPSWIHSTLDLDRIRAMMEAQQRLMLTKKHRARTLFLLLDDCVYDRSVLRNKTMRNLFMQIRHLNCYTSVTVQSVHNVPPDVRQMGDYVFCTHESSLSVRKQLYTYFYSVFPTFEEFDIVFRTCTRDHAVLVIDNTIMSPQQPSDCVFWYRADPDPEPFTFGNPVFHRLADEHAAMRAEQAKERPRLEARPRKVPLEIEVVPEAPPLTPPLRTAEPIAVEIA